MRRFEEEAKEEVRKNNQLNFKKEKFKNQNEERNQQQRNMKIEMQMKIMR